MPAPSVSMLVCAAMLLSPICRMPDKKIHGQYFLFGSGKCSQNQTDSNTSAPNRNRYATNVIGGKNVLAVFMTTQFMPQIK